MKRSQSYTFPEKFTRKKVRIVMFLAIGITGCAFVAVLLSDRISVLRAEPAHFTVSVIACLTGMVCCAVLGLLAAHTIKQHDYTEHVLLENKERYRSIIAASNTGAWEFHSDTAYQWCSPEYFEMLGYDAEEFVKSNTLSMQHVWIDFLHPEDRKAATDHFTRYLASGSTGMYEGYFRMKHKTGKWVWIWSRGQTLRKADGTISNITLGTHIDITEKKNLEIELRKRNEKLLKYAHLNAHEVRGPLARLLGLIEVSKLETGLGYDWFFEKVKYEATDIDRILKVITKELDETPYDHSRIEA